MYIGVNGRNISRYIKKEKKEDTETGAYQRNLKNIQERKGKSRQKYTLNIHHSNSKWRSTFCGVSSA